MALRRLAAKTQCRGTIDLGRGDLPKLYVIARGYVARHTVNKNTMMNSQEVYTHPSQRVRPIHK